MSNLIDRQAAIDSLTLNAGWKDEEGRSVEDWDERKKIWTALISLIPSAQPETCEGCKHLGKWENEVEYGCLSPCTCCKRRVDDNYER